MDDVDEVPAFARAPSELEEDESLLDDSFDDDEEDEEDSDEEDSFEEDSFDVDESDESLEEPDSRSLRRPLALAPWSFL